jgi:hypothetical protein
MSYIMDPLISMESIGITQLPSTRPAVNQTSLMPLSFLNYNDMVDDLLALWQLPMFAVHTT